jgi:hypothetical protein
VALDSPDFRNESRNHRPSPVSRVSNSSRLSLPSSCVKIAAPWPAGGRPKDDLRRELLQPGQRVRFEKQTVVLTIEFNCLALRRVDQPR